MASACAGIRLEGDLADVGEHVADGAGRAEVAGVFGEDGADRAAGAVAVVGQGFDDDGDAAGAVTFVADFLKVLAIGASGLLDGALDVVFRHVLGARVLDGEAQARVHFRVGRAGFGGDGDFAGELGEQLGTLGVLLALAMHDVLVLGMASHGSSGSGMWSLMDFAPL